MNLPEIPERLAAAIHLLRGEEEGNEWLAALPRRMQLYAHRWNLELLEIAIGGAMSCCVYCRTADGIDTVLKIPVDAASGRLDSLSLSRWARVDAGPEILATARHSGAFLMRRILPGTTAVPAGDPEDSARFCDLVRRMQDPTLDGLKGLRSLERVVRMRLEWAVERFADPGYEAYSARLPLAENLLDHLLATTPRVDIIHGDLQYKNILTGPDGQWMAIDPFTCRGDLNAEAALWAVVQADDSAVDERIDQLAECEALDPARLRGWSFIFAVAEYRTYWEPNARRLRSFLAKEDARQR